MRLYGQEEKSLTDLKNLSSTLCPLYVMETNYLEDSLLMLPLMP